MRTVYLVTAGQDHLRNAADLFPDTYGLGRDPRHACEVALEFSGLDTAEIQARGLDDTSLSPDELCDLLRQITGSPFSIDPFDYDPRFFRGI